ncbi:MAG: glycosyltransferase family 4 protein [Acidobacteria bacterium]|nr:glycosyltransferase family 4 protein [Acidobacteriota bacterium]
MRFCMVNTYYPPYHYGGDAVFVQGLARALATRGHHVEVVHCGDAFRIGRGRRRTAADYNDGVVVHRLESNLGALSPIITQQTGQPGLKSRQLKAIFDRGFDVVNFHNISLAGGPGMLSMSNAPVNLYTLHEHWMLCGTHIFWKDRSKACDERQCLRCCVKSGVPPQLWRYTGLLKQELRHIDEILSPSAYTARRHAEADLGRPIRVMPSFSSVQGNGKERQTADQRPRFVFSGRVTASKGVDWLTEWFAKWPQYDLDVLGTGDILDDLRRRYANCPSIQFHGAIEHADMAVWYQNATALILPSRAPEVFPLCILEAFACGTPAIVSTAGGAPEAVERSGAGVVYRNDREFQQAVEALAEDSRLAAQMGRLGRRAYEELYSENRYVSDYLALIESIQDRKARTSKGQHQLTVPQVGSE